MRDRAALDAALPLLLLRKYPNSAPAPPPFTHDASRITGPLSFHAGNGGPSPILLAASHRGFDERHPGRAVDHVRVRERGRDVLSQALADLELVCQVQIRQRFVEAFRVSTGHAEIRLDARREIVVFRALPIDGDRRT